MECRLASRFERELSSASRRVRSGFHSKPKVQLSRFIANSDERRKILYGYTLCRHIG